jgi:hypothetical protein
MRGGSLAPALWRAPGGVAACCSARLAQPSLLSWRAACAAPPAARSASAFTSMKEAAARAVISHALDSGIVAERIGDGGGGDAQAGAGAGELYDAEDAETWRAIAVRPLWRRRRFDAAVATDPRCRGD